MKILNFKINFWFLLIVFLIISNFSSAQGVLPIQRYVVKGIATNYSFGYSLRDINLEHDGFAVRVRRAADGAEGDVEFDSNGVVSIDSMVSVAVAGTSGLAIGSEVPFSTFKGAQPLFVSIWYNQGDATFNATQPNTALQPELQLNTAGTDNTLPSIYFSGSTYLVINQTIDKILDGGIKGTFLLALKATRNIDHYAFGYRSGLGSEWRWSFHINWTDGNAFFDSGEVCCTSSSRYFPNGQNLNKWKQYTFIRGTSYKTARVDGVNTILNNSSAPSVAPPSFNATSFGIGTGVNSGLATSFYGYMSEVLMYNFDKLQSEVVPIEKNQIDYWKL